MRCAVLVTFVALASGVAFWAKASELENLRASQAYWMGWGAFCWAERNGGALLPRGLE